MLCLIHISICVLCCVRVFFVFALHWGIVFWLSQERYVTQNRMYFLTSKYGNIFIPSSSLHYSVISWPFCHFLINHSVFVTHMLCIVDVWIQFDRKYTNTHNIFILFPIEWIIQQQTVITLHRMLKDRQIVLVRRRKMCKATLAKSEPKSERYRE